MAFVRAEMVFVRAEMAFLGRTAAPGRVGLAPLT